MQFGVMFFASDENALSGSNKYRVVIESAKFADRHGFSSVWVPERHFTQLGCLYPNPAVLHAALSRETERIRLHAGSVVLPLHNPIRVAEEWAVVDNLSGGRVGLSFASGWNPDDFAFFPERYKDRAAEMYAGIREVQRLWRGEPALVTNGTGKQVEVRVYPTPVQPELPMWITAAGNPETFTRAGELGANLLTHLLDQGVDRLAERIQLYRQARARHGHDPQAGRVSIMLHTFVGEDFETVREQARAPYCEYLKANIGLLKGLAQSRVREIDLSTLSPAELDEFVNFLYERFVSSRALIGTPDTCLDLVAQLHEAGVDEIACLLDFGPSADLLLENLPYLNQLRETCQAQFSSASRDTGVNDLLLQERILDELGGGGLRPAERPLSKVEQIRVRCSAEVSGEDFYRQVAEAGAEYGPSMRSIERLWRGDGEVLGRLRLNGGMESEIDEYNFHPVLLDNCFLLLAALAAESISGAEKLLALPTGMRRLRVHKRPTAELWSHVVRKQPESEDTLVGDVQIFNQAGELVAEAEGLRIQLVHQEGKRAPHADGVDELLYQIEWQAQARREAPPLMDGRGHWLVFADRTGVGQELAASLTARGQSVTTVVAGERFESLGQRRYQVNPARPEDSSRLLREISDAGEVSLRGVVHLWSLDATSSAVTTPETLEHDQALNLTSVLGLIQSLAASGREQMPRVWLCTRGAQRAGDESSPLEVAQSPLWGLGRVASVEHPDLWGGLVDLDPKAAAPDSAEQLLGVMLDEMREDQVALRGGERLVARLVRSPQTGRDSQEVRFDADGSYLITGGLGDLGLSVARWMAVRGARHIVLLSRTKLAARSAWKQVEAGSRLAHQVAAVEELERIGARVYLAPVDVADESQLSAFLKAFSEEGRPPIRGVMHTAAVAHGATIRNLTADTLAPVLRPKVAGTWNLHRLLADAELDFFVLFSAIPALVGYIGAGAANYSAANAFLDTLAHYRRQQGKTAVSINYGPWNQIGLAVREGGIDQLARQGIGSMSPEQGLKALERILADASPQVAVAMLDWQQFFRAFPQSVKSPLLYALAQDEGDRQADGGERNQIQQALLTAAPEDRPLLLEEYLREQVSAVLALEPSRIDVHWSLISMGLDSLMAIDLRNRIESELGVVVPMVSLLKGPSIVDLVGDVLPSMNFALEEEQLFGEMEEITL